MSGGNGRCLAFGVFHLPDVAILSGVGQKPLQARTTKLPSLRRNGCGVQSFTDGCWLGEMMP